MPVYEFHLRNSASGEIVATVAVPLPVDDRDSLVIERAAVPRTLTVSCNAMTEQQLQANQVLRGYQAAERRIGSNAEFQRRIGHSPKQIKSAWKNE